MRKTSKRVGSLRTTRARAAEIKIPKETLKLIEYIDSIGVTDNVGLRVLSASESRLKIGLPALFHL